MLVAKFIIDYFKLRNINIIYGLPGHATIPFDWQFKEDRKLLNGNCLCYGRDNSCLNNQLNYVNTSNEYNASLMASAYGLYRNRELPGSIGAYVVTAGVGCGMTVNSLITAYYECQPMIAILTTPPTNEQHQGVFQYMETAKIIKPYIKDYEELNENNIHQLDTILNRLFNSAIKGNNENPGWGPVALIVPTDLFNYTINKVPTIIEPTRELVSNRLKNDVKLIVNKLIKSKRITLVCGYGCEMDGSLNLIKKLVSLLKLPVVTTWKGRGVIPENMNLSMVNGGAFGTHEANAATYHADVIIELGNRCYNLGQKYEERFNVFYSDESKKFIINTYPLTKNKKYLEDMPYISNYTNSTFIYSNTFDFLEELLNQLTDNKICTIRNNNYNFVRKLVQIKKFYLENSTYPDENDCSKISEYQMVKQINKYISCNGIMKNGIMVTGVGIYWWMVPLLVRIDMPKRMLSTFIQSPIGCGIPYALGIYHSGYTGPIYVVEGDGGILSSSSSLFDLANTDANIKIFVSDNAAYGAITINELQSHNNHYTNHSLTFNMDRICNVKKLVTSLNIPYYRVENSSDYYKIQEAINSDKKAFVHVKTSCCPFYQIKPTPCYFKKIWNMDTDIEHIKCSGD